MQILTLAAILPTAAQYGHYTYECKAAEATYLARPSRTQQLKNPKVCCGRAALLNMTHLPYLRMCHSMETARTTHVQSFDCVFEMS